MNNSIRLSDFILWNMESILEAWENFAQTIHPPAIDTDSKVLRDHAELMLKVIALDLDTQQNPLEQFEKSKGLAPKNSSTTPAEDHAEDRLSSGYTIAQLISEYRALRASVLHLWEKNLNMGLSTDAEDITRFNEAIDQSIAESVARYALLVKNSQDMFLAILGHDLRNPLSTSIMSSAMIMNYNNVDEKILLNAKRIYASSQRMSRLISDLMDYSSNQLGNKFLAQIAPANFINIFTNILDEHKVAYPHRDFVVETDGKFEGEWDEQRIAQMFSNLLGNAVQHSDLNSPIKIHLFSTVNTVNLKITNYGVPIPTSKISFIFDPLYRHVDTENSDYKQPKSLGLGLYIVKQIVLAHNGKLNVTSSKLEGTIFEVSLPMKA